MLKDGFGQDLAARNIQRGRDHGLPGYVEYRQLCGLYVPKDWDGKPEDITQDSWNKLRKVYSNVEDIDAFTGSVSEVSVADGLVGATNFRKMVHSHRELLNPNCRNTMGTSCGELSNRDLHPQIQLMFSPTRSR